MNKIYGLVSFFKIFIVDKIKKEFCDWRIVNNLLRNIVFIDCLERMIKNGKVFIFSYFECLLFLWFFWFCGFIEIDLIVNFKILGNVYGKVILL